MPIKMEKEHYVKRSVLILVFLCLEATWARSETVMLYVRDMTTDEDSAEASISFFMALEDGVMDQFFESGHIIFDSGLQYVTVEEERFPERTAVRMAKSGGARVLLEIDMTYPPGPRDHTVLPLAARFTVSDILSGDSLHQGTISFSSIVESEKGNPKSDEELCTIWGKTIAGEALRYLP